MIFVNTVVQDVLSQHEIKIKPIFVLKCPYYAFSNITFHVVCHVAVCEHKLSAKL